MRGTVRRLRHTACLHAAARAALSTLSSAVMLGLALGAISLLGGCSVLSPLPIWELTKAGAAAASMSMSSMAPSTATEAIHHGLPTEGSICVEYNEAAPAPDLLPALLGELAAQGKRSRVYDKAGATTGCDAWLRYSGFVQWGVPPMGDDQRPYLTQATLWLRDDRGRLIASSHYDLEAQSTRMGQWATTRSKLQPLVKALFQSPQAAL